MPRKKISKKQGFSLDDMPGLKIKNKKNLKPFNASKRLKDKDYISKALWECLVDNEKKSFAPTWN